jgi:hypothetical protein
LWFVHTTCLVKWLCANPLCCSICRPCHHLQVQLPAPTSASSPQPQVPPLSLKCPPSRHSLSPRLAVPSLIIHVSQQGKHALPWIFLLMCVWLISKKIVRVWSLKP